MKLPFLKTGKLRRKIFRFGSRNYFFPNRKQNFLEPRFWAPYPKKIPGIKQYRRKEQRVLKSCLSQPDFNRHIAQSAGVAKEERGTLLFI